jgi:SAM-dependent methyltransferase
VFGEVAALYDRARPTYPAELVDTVVALIGGTGVAVDAGCGTGKAAVLLAERGLSGVGVEPSADMAAVARTRLEPFPGWRVEECDFEDFAGRDGAADLVTAAQSWHWMDPARGLEQAHRLLRPGGWLALWWNRPSAGEATTLRSDIDAVYERVTPDLGSRLPGRKGRPPAGEMDGRFRPPTTREFAWSTRYTTAQYCDLMSTQSDHRLLPPEQLGRLLRGIAAVIDGAGGTIEVGYTTDLWAAERRR